MTFAMGPRDIQQAVDLPLACYELLVRKAETPYCSLRMSALAEIAHTKLNFEPATKEEL